MSKNTIYEAFDNSAESQDAPSQEQLLMKESDILAGLLELGNEKDNKESYRTIQIKRNGVLKLEFRIRPITEEENQICWRRATKYAPSKAGQPKTAIETNTAKYRSYLIYSATVDEDRARIWDNKQAMDALGVLQAVDLIDKVLLAGEKSRVLEQIDAISGFDMETEELAGN